ncbi:sulfotransferase [Pseudomonadota bacterium]
MSNKKRKTKQGIKKTAKSKFISPARQKTRLQQAMKAQLAGKTELAIDRYQRIIAEHPDFVPAKYLLANLLKAQGEFVQATSYYEQIMALQPDYTQAHFTYSGIHKYQDENDPHIGLMRELYLKKDLQTDNRIHLAFALSKAFEDIEDYGQAFQFLQAGNDLRYKTFNYRIEGDEELINSIIQAFSRDALARLHINAENSNKPIFIVGMPRSGTSLVEKIIGAHTDVYAAGELDYFFSLGVSQFLNESNHFQFSSLDSYSMSAFENLGKAYLEKTSLLDKQTRHISDKLPFNMMMIGLIKIALPNAKIIHCVRDAKDNCLSIFKQNFTTGNYRFAYNLKTLGQFHNLYQKLMKHWHEVLPNAIYDISYESLTQNPETEIRKLLAACGLEWQESCMNFEKNAGIVKTASFYQVRQPMYTSSINLWEKYQEFLKPLLDELDVYPY